MGRSREWWENNKEKHRATCRSWYRNNKDKHYAISEKWKKDNADKVKAYRKEYRLKNADKIKARRKLYLAINKGLLIRPDVCDMCKEQRKVDAHHSDYNEPLKVDWVCKSCHGVLHTEYKEDLPLINQKGEKK